ncbi:Uncharacterised protein [Campylobacter lari]|nr:Uncharacterised protein [Campylobacter lari]
MTYGFFILKFYTSLWTKWKIRLSYGYFITPTAPPFILL